MRGMIMGSASRNGSNGLDIKGRNRNWKKEF